MLRQCIFKSLVLLAAAALSSMHSGLAQPASPRPEFDMRPNEIRLDGTIREVNPAQNALVLDVATFTRSNGATYQLPESQSRKVLINAGTVLRVRGSEQRATLADLREGTSAIVTGMSLPDRENWLAREVAVWSRMEAGRFYLDGLPQRATRSPREDTEAQAALTASRTASAGSPAVTFFSPAPNAVYDSFPVISGTASNNTGVSRVDIYISRSDTGQSWTGSGWSAPWTSIALPTTVSGPNWSYTGAVPGAEIGTYIVRANVYDRSGRSAGGRGVWFRIGEMAPPIPGLPPLVPPPGDDFPQADLPPGSLPPMDGVTNPRRMLTGHIRRVTATAFSPDGALLASGSADTTVRLWDVATGQLMQTLRGHSDVVTSLTFSPNGEILATGSGGVRPDDTIFGEVRLWDARTGQWLQTLAGHEGLVKSLAFSNDGRMLATGANDGRVKLWITSSVVDPRARWREKMTLPRPPTRYRPVQSVAFSSEGLTLTVLHTDWAVFRYETQSGSSVQGTLSGPNTGVLLSAAAISPDGTLVAVGTETTPSGIGGGRPNGTGSAQEYGQVRLVKLWSPRLSLYRTLRGHSDSVTAMTFSPDGTWLATGSRDSTVSLWDMQTVTGERRLGEHGGRVTTITFSPDGTMLATGSEDSTIRLWDVQLEAVQP